MLKSSFNSEVLGKVGALVSGSHIVYTSGRHGSSYVNKDAIYPHTDLTQKVCAAMAEPFRHVELDAVLAPAIGAVILGQWMAHFLSQWKGKEILSVYAEQTPEKTFVIKRGYDQLIAHKKVLIAEDVLTTGSSVRKVIEVARKIPCEIIGVSALCNRGGVTAEQLGSVPQFHALFSLNMESWEAADCPLCKNQVPLNTALGKGKEFLANQGKKG